MFEAFVLVGLLVASIWMAVNLSLEIEENISCLNEKYVNTLYNHNNIGDCC